MQVSQLAELDSHAVIGGSIAQEFILEDSPELYSMLSDKMYRDKKLAVVREVICNADDAHKMGAGVNKPIEIVLTDEELKIRDFGPGIPEELMHPIYCVYGRSTKLKDDKATGSFGLGSKSPFAYSDHFTVDNCHAGFRTVYAISRGGIDTKGKPALIPMVRVPTEDTGLTVTIPIKNRSDRVEFERLIRQVVSNGGMFVKLNGTELVCMDFSGIDKTGYGWVRADLTESHVYVRLGAVLYPLTTDNPELTALVNTFKNSAGRLLVLSARPGEVGVTPSRESLSYTEETIASLTERLQKIIGQINRHMPIALKRAAEKQLKKQKTAVININFYPTAIDTRTISDPLEIAESILGNAYADRDRYGHLSSFKQAAGDSTKALFKAAQKLHRDYRRFFRRAGGGARKFMDDRHNVSYYHWHPESGKQLYRIAGKLGILDHLSRSVKTRSDKALNVQPIRKSAEAFACKPTIVFVRSRSQASAYLAGKIDGDDKTVFLTVRHMKTEEILQIKATFEQAKFEVVTLDIAKPAPKPKAVKAEKAPDQTTFYDLTATYDSYPAPRLQLSSPMTAPAPVFIDCGTLLDHNKLHTPGRIFVTNKAKVFAVYPNVSLSLNAAQKKALIAAGSRDIKEVFSEELLTIQKTPEMLFAIAAASRRVFKTSAYGDSASFASTLAYTDLRFANLLTGRKSIDPAEERVFNLMKLYRSEMVLNEDHKTSNYVNDLHSAAAKETIKTIDLSYLKTLADLGSNASSIKWSEDLSETIRFLQARHAKTKTIPSPQALLKEAA